MDKIEDSTVNPEAWPKLTAQALDFKIEEQIEKILHKLTLQQKIDQVI